MAARALLLILAAGFLWITEAFLAISLFTVLDRHFHTPVAALLTAVAALVLTGMFAMLGLWRRRSSPAFGAGALGLWTLSTVSRIAERHPFATVAVAAGLGVLQAVLFGRRR